MQLYKSSWNKNSNNKHEKNYKSVIQREIKRNMVLTFGFDDLYNVKLWTQSHNEVWIDSQITKTNFHDIEISI